MSTFLYLQCAKIWQNMFFFLKNNSYPQIESELQLFSALFETNWADWEGIVLLPFIMSCVHFPVS